MGDAASHVALAVLVALSVLNLRATKNHHEQVMKELCEKREHHAKDGDGNVAGRK